MRSLVLLSVASCWLSVETSAAAEYDDDLFVDIVGGPDDASSEADAQSALGLLFNGTMCPSVEQHYCDGGRCIPLSWLCDHERDCEDASDEPPSCESPTCAKGYFTCTKTGRCLPSGYRCDGQNDCGVTLSGEEDNSDEDDEICNVHTFKCPASQFKCASTNECIRLELFCNGRNDCSDLSDEGDFCTDDSPSPQCAYGIARTYAGPLCYCPDGFQTAGKTRQECKDENECERVANGLRPVCGQRCTNVVKTLASNKTSAGYACACEDGYALDVQKVDCDIKHVSSAKLLVGSSNGITVFNHDFTKREWSIDGYGLHAFDYDYDSNKICYVTTIFIEHVPARHIECEPMLADRKKARAKRTRHYVSIELTGVHRMRYDWVGRNWYFLDDAFNRIFVCSNEFAVCRVIFRRSFVKAKDMVLDARVGLLFLTDWDTRQPGISRVQMDGTSFQRIVNSSVIHPMALALDLPTRTLYFLDTYLEFIHAVDYDGRNKRRLVSQSHKFKQHATMATFGRLLYLSPSEAVYKGNGSLLSMEHPGVRFYSKVNSLIAYHRVMQPVNPKAAHVCSADSTNPCSHLCLVAYSNPDASSDHTCLCEEGYQEDAPGKCSLRPPDVVLLFGQTQPGAVGFLPVLQPNATAVVSPFIRKITRPAAIAVRPSTKQIFFSDAKNYTIEVQKYGTTERSIFIDSGISNVEGMAVDDAGGNVYFTDDGLSQISVARIARPDRKRVIVADNFTHPRAIVLHNEYIFWTDWADGTLEIVNGEENFVAKIERALADGSERRAIVSSKIHWPNGLAAQGDWVYWCDAYYDVIERVKLDGSQRTLLLKLHALAHPYGIALHGDWLLWSEFQHGQILRVRLDLASGSVLQPTQLDSAGGQAAEVFYSHTSPVFELEILNTTTKPAPTACSTDNGGCAHLCVVVAGKARCLCADGHQPADPSANRCEPDPTYTSSHTCTAEQFQCQRNKQCISRRYICDGDKDCGDGSDEAASLCGGVQCRSATEFKCRDNRCIHAEWMCDGEPDCTYADDEAPELCKNFTRQCSKSMHQCAKSGRCIQPSWICDFERDCGDDDLSDEPDTCAYPACSRNQYQCLNKQCIALSFVCDGENDCKDGSDEAHCSDLCPKGIQFQCPGSARCLDKIYMCDGVWDCADGFDERDCRRPPHVCERVNQWHCNASDTCIRQAFRCDGHTDCADGSDEADCDTIICGEHEFGCADNQRCVPKRWRCDGADDCADGSDELECVGLPPSVAAKCAYPRRTCRNDTSQCVTVDQLCNRVEDCADGSDEGLLCEEHVCTDSRGASSSALAARANEHPACDQLCYDAPDGYACDCRPGFKLQPDRRSCSKADPCRTFGVCSQLCVSTPNHYLCECRDGYALAADKFTCKPERAEPAYIVYSVRHELRLMTLATGNIASLVTNLRNSISLDFFYVGDGTYQLFWTDITADKIYAGRLQNGTLTHITAIIEQGVSTPEGIAVDWVTRKLYWVDSSLDQIEVANLDGRMRTTVLAGNMTNLRALVLDPRRGLMFWTDWDEANPRIERASLAGSDRRIIVQGLTDFGGGWPNGLALDYHAEKLYWIDAKADLMQAVNYDGSGLIDIVSKHAYLSHPFALSVDDNYVYWTDWSVKSIVRANKWNGTAVTIINTVDLQPYDIKVMHSSRQPRALKQPCADGNGGCSHLCLLDSTTAAKCACPFLYRLNDDGKTCEPSRSVLLYARPQQVSGVQLSSSSHANASSGAMPVLTHAKVADVRAMAVHMASQRLFWYDNMTRAIYASHMDGSNVTLLADDELNNVDSLAVNWAEGNLYWSSWWSPQAGRYFNALAAVSVMTFDGAYRAVVLQRSLTNQTSGLVKPSSLVVDPDYGKLYWFDRGYDPVRLYSAQTNGANVRVLLGADGDRSLPADVTSLCVQPTSHRLYWLDASSHNIYAYDVNAEKLVQLQPPADAGWQAAPKQLAVLANDSLVFIDTSAADTRHHYLGIVHVVDDTLSAPVVVRNLTLVHTIAVADSEQQQGGSACTAASGHMYSQLCFKSGEHSYVPGCAHGYTLDGSNCIGPRRAIFYVDSGSRRLHSLVDEDAANHDAIAPVPATGAAADVDFLSGRQTVFWLDANANRIMSIRTDLTNRTVVVDGGSGSRITAFAVDWATGNVYWSALSPSTSPSMSSLNGEPTIGNSLVNVCASDGQHPLALRTITADHVRAIHVDPVKGYLFTLTLKQGIQRWDLDMRETEPKTLVAAEGRELKAISVDAFSHTLYYLDQQAHAVFGVDYEGDNQVDVYHYEGDITAMTVHNSTMYWYNNELQSGTLSSAVIVDGKLDRRRQMKRHQLNLNVDRIRLFDTQLAPALAEPTNPCADGANGNCAQLCLIRVAETSGRLNAYCACSFSRLADDDHKSCKNYTEFLAVSASTRIEFVQLSSGRNRQLNAPYRPIESADRLRNAVAIAADPEHKRIFYSDTVIGQILAVRYGDASSSQQPIVIATGVGSVEGVQYDVVHGDLYWTSNTNRSINRVHVDDDDDGDGGSGRPAVRLIQLQHKDKPRALAIDICDYHIYWTNWNEERPRIERSYLSGYRRESIVHTQLAIPNALAVDLLARKLYWADAGLDKIERAELDGRDRQVLSIGQSSHAFSMAVHDDYLYITDWERRALLRVNKLVGGSGEVVRDDFDRQPMSVVVVSPNATSRLCLNTACHGPKAPECAELCLLDERGAPYCGCRGGRLLNPLTNQCQEHGSTACAPDEFDCADGSCIPYELTCDGTPQCTSARDEQTDMCGTRICRTGYFSCGNSRCVRLNRTCDGADDCGNGFDEGTAAGCACSPLTHFACADDRSCIPLTQRCDWHKNCDDVSDEMQCAGINTRNCTAERIGNSSMINCPFTTQCIMAVWICDNQTDCWDGWDESKCDAVLQAREASCSASDFTCVSSRRVGNATTCIPLSWRCDHDRDCIDGSDEADCGTICDATSEFACASGSQCVPKAWRCDEQLDCGDGSDEKGCAAKTCDPSRQFQCVANGKCVPSSWRCDGADDCQDASDEHNCTVIHSGSRCGVDEFSCQTGGCVPVTFYCDGRDDCGDGSDEPAGCQLASCQDDQNKDQGRQFACASDGKCVRESLVCDGVLDCLDGSDEDDARCAATALGCKSHEYECANRVCVSLNATCDRVNDCGDWTDEMGCGVNECAESQPCDQICKDDPRIGYHCSCHDRYELAEDKHTCRERDMCESLPCSQHCHSQSGGGYRCYCAPGYELQPDQHTCKHASDEPIQLVISARYYIYSYEVFGNVTVLKHRLLTNLTNAVAVDFDWRAQQLYWTDVTSANSYIGRVGLQQQPASYKVFQGIHADYADGIAYDWAAQNVYWTDKAAGKIMVASRDGLFASTLYENASRLQHPRAIVVDPLNKVLFYSDWGERAHIGRMSMDGQNASVLVDRIIRWPNALAIDAPTRRVFWGDAKLDYIASCDYEGGGRRDVIKGSKVRHIFSLSVFEQFVYWTDWHSDVVWRAHKHTGKGMTKLIANIAHRPMGIKVVHPALQPTLHVNACEQGGWCANLCLLSSQAAAGHVCRCAQSFKPLGELDCVPDCQPWQFVCEHTYKCIPRWWRCDGQDDCGDGQDELYHRPGACPAFHCMPGQWQCQKTDEQASATCVSQEQLCDGHVHCPLGDDEGGIPSGIDCASYSCMAEQFKCPNASLCLPLASRCDGHRDCPGGQDEWNCADEWQCDVRTQHGCLTNGTHVCLPNTFVCDGQADCDDGSDEKECEARTCGLKDYRCANGRCIPAAWRCDAQRDCADGEDEADCGADACDLASQFRCAKSMACVPIDWQCDGQRDCADGSDEKNCGGGDGGRCARSEFSCADGSHCIDWTLRCDNRTDCADGSDELACPYTYAHCSADEWQCVDRSGCIPRSWRCDGHADCADRSDEATTARNGSCSAECRADRGLYQCADGSCIRDDWRCDGVADCDDDELPAVCARRACAAHLSKCDSGLCFPTHLACDGVPQCRDASDESELMCAAGRHDCVNDANAYACANGRFTCAKHRCDGFNDCGDNSDEQDCASSLCERANCSQKCAVVNALPKCYCDVGYAMTENKHCRATGGVAQLLRVNYAGHLSLWDVRHQNTESDKVVDNKSSTVQTAFEQANVDFIVEGRHLVLISVNQTAIASPQLGADWLIKVPLKAYDTPRRRRRAVEAASPSRQLVGRRWRGRESASVTVDWWQQLLFYSVTSGATSSIRLARLDADSPHATVVQSNVGRITSMAVVPPLFRLFWADIVIGASHHLTGAKIEASAYDGTSRRVLVSHNLLEPVSLSVDVPSRRLYWIDRRAGTVESVSLNGRERRRLAAFGVYAQPEANMRPAVLDVFEDHVYVGTSSHAVLRLHKLTGTQTILRHDQGIPTGRLLKLLHPVKRLPPSDDALLVGCNCTSPTDVCVQTGPDITTCVCTQPAADCASSSSGSLSPTVLSCFNNGRLRDGQCECEPGFVGARCEHSVCHNRCLHNASCVLNLHTNHVYCQCPLEYDGERCERFKCAGQCTKHGACHVGNDGLPQCRCHGGYSGLRCELKLDPCAGFCYNNGNCSVFERFNMPVCTCQQHYHGHRCQHCSQQPDDVSPSIECHNDGHCRAGRCVCQPGFVGERCEIDKCDGYCVNGGSCVRRRSAVSCECPPGYEGHRCQHDKCKNYCLNNGICIHLPTGPLCLCGPSFAGVQCERSQNCSQYCGPHSVACSGHVAYPAQQYSCTCAQGYTGERCDMPIPCHLYCHNGASCDMQQRPDGSSRPYCHCPQGLTGERCEAVSAVDCDRSTGLQCQNNGVCVWEPAAQQRPFCMCGVGWTGHVCTLATCSRYCLNGGTCQLLHNRALCHCDASANFYGDRCELQFVEIDDSNVAGYALMLCVAAASVLLLSALLYLAVVKRHRLSHQFKHSRMSELEEMENPVFMQGEDDTTTTRDNAPLVEREVTNFSNPTYDTVYNDTVTTMPYDSQEQQHTLLAKVVQHNKGNTVNT